ncbi:MAG: ribosome biogenesis GTPase Der [Sutterellaceae bacterium]|nr:ribosome biogenesis GTPase Der [Sutterellaceae bacterium]MDD7441947.1 ribosome biogenesis GTPase Der [Sutterellaceae bacterium]MDY2867783.1 ribosome biogenesis GTPase Der [Mesosutterella sp.]
MLPVIALVGRPNVGKSTLYNRLTRTRDAIVADYAGLTRDRHYGDGKVGPRPYIVIDTGGFEPVRPEGIVGQMASQAELAIEESDAVIFVVDARTGVTPQDHRIAQTLRESGRKVYLAVNKAEGLSPVAASEFYELGLGVEPYLVSAAHGQGIATLMDDVLSPFPEEEPKTGDEKEAEEGGEHRIRVAIAGRPNVGKSTLVNALLGEDRVVAFDLPGTTRDAINVDFDYDGHPYTLVDTAGLRKKGKVFEAIEKFSVVKTLQAIADSNVVVLVIDARSGVAEHDAHIAEYALDAGRALVVAVNKWDGLSAYERTQRDQQLEMKLRFLHWARFVHISALKRNGLNHLMKAVSDAYTASMARLPTPKLTRSLIEAVNRQQPPRAGKVRPKMRYAHQGGSNPPVIVIHGNSLQSIGDSYRRYLESWFRDQFGLAGTPLKIEFKTGRNPYADPKAAGDRKK